MRLAFHAPRKLLELLDDNGGASATEPLNCSVHLVFVLVVFFLGD